jgi:hypothetical protein
LALCRKPGGLSPGKSLRNRFPRPSHFFTRSACPFQPKPVFLGSVDICPRNCLLRHIKQRFRFTAVQAQIGLRTAVAFRHSSSDCGNRRSDRTRMAQNRSEVVPFSPVSLPLAVSFSSAKALKPLDK